MSKPEVTIDNSSSFTQAGSAGQRKPKFVLRTVSHSCGAAMTWETQWRPTIAESTAGFTVAPRTYPLEHGIIEDWDSMENLWSHLYFCGLKVPPEEQPLLMADSPSCPFLLLHMANTRFLSLCAYGRVTGLAVKAGAGSHVSSVYLGQTWREATYCLGVASGTLSRHLHSLLMESPNDPLVLNALKRKTVIQLKKQCCYVSIDYEGDLQNQGYHHTARFQTPNGRWITPDKERFCCPEPLFQPTLLYQSSPGLHHLALQSLQKVPDHARRDTVGNIVLSGGSSMFPGFRMCLELNALFQSTGSQIQVLASPERSTAAWAGGSMAASLMSFQPTCTRYSTSNMPVARAVNPGHAGCRGQLGYRRPQRSKLEAMHIQGTAAKPGF
ncbi:LOW QUALITY PROTEIN: actin-like protein 10 [Pterocles gutturalis]